MFRRSFLAGLAGIAIASVATIPAQASQWVMLGQQSVGLNPDRDVFHVGMDEGRYEALRFRVLGNRVAFAETRVVYANGSSEVLNVKEHVHEGETTRAYDLQGRHRRIERIEVIYQAEIPWAGKATVQVFGLKFTGYEPDSNWAVLGTKDVNMVVDHDVIDVGFGSGRFRAIRFHVTGRPVHLYDIRVKFANGQTQTYNFNRHIPAGGYSPPLDLAGDQRVIDRIHMVYRSESFGGHAKMTVYGQH